MLGSSPVTSILGYIIIALTVLNQVVVEQGIPHDGKGWITLIGGVVTGIAFRMSKDANKTNSPVPTAEAQTVGKQ